MDLFRKRVAKNLQKTFKELKVSAIVAVDYTGNIRISGPEIEAWLRLTVVPLQTGKRINQVDINNIQIAYEMRNKRIFTRMMLNLRQLKTVNSIIITSVVSHAMHGWCRKNGCSIISCDYNGNPMDYKYK